MTFRAIFRLAIAIVCTAALAQQAIASQAIPQIPAFLPYSETVPESAALPIDGIWRISSLGKRIRIEKGRAFALDPWLHLFVLKIERGMVVIKDIARDGSGGYQGADLPAMGKWSATQESSGNLSVSVAGMLGPIRYRLIPVQLDDVPDEPIDDSDEDQNWDDEEWDEEGEDGEEEWETEEW